MATLHNLLADKKPAESIGSAHIGFTGNKDIRVLCFIPLNEQRLAFDDLKDYEKSILRPISQALLELLDRANCKFHTKAIDHIDIYYRSGNINSLRFCVHSCCFEFIASLENVLASFPFTVEGIPLTKSYV